MNYQSIFDAFHTFTQNPIVWIVVTITFIMISNYFLLKPVITFEPIVRKSARELLADMAEDDRRKAR